MTIDATESVGFRDSLQGGLLELFGSLQARKVRVILADENGAYPVMMPIFIGGGGGDEGGLALLMTSSPCCTSTTSSFLGFEETLDFLFD